MTQINFKKHWDQPSRIPKRKYVICTTPRSGSNLLTFALGQQNIGLPQEYLNWKTNGFLSFCQRVGITTPPKITNISEAVQDNFQELSLYIQAIQQYRTSQNGIFGTKVFAEDLASNEQAFEAMNTTFGKNTFYIYLYRKDMIAQAVSLYFAFQTSIWHSNSTVKPSIDTVEFNFLHILHYFKQIKENNSYWLKIFSKNKNLPIYRLSYSELTSNYEQTITKINSLLGITDIEIPPPPIQKQYSPLKEEFKERFIQMIREGKSYK